jgi:hypothetical protein
MIAIVHHGRTWRIAVSDVTESASFDPTGWLRSSTSSGPAAAHLPAASVMTEVMRASGGMLPRALVGGHFHAGGSELRLEVGSTGDLTLGANQRCPSRLGSPLVAGLPVEFAQPLLDGLTKWSSLLPPGVLRVDYAAYDEVESSAVAFEHAGRALSWAMSALISGADLTNENVAGLLESWAV